MDDVVVGSSPTLCASAGSSTVEREKFLHSTFPGNKVCSVWCSEWILHATARVSVRIRLGAKVPVVQPGKSAQKEKATCDFSTGHKRLRVAPRCRCWILQTANLTRTATEFSGQPLYQRCSLRLLRDENRLQADRCFDTAVRGRYFPGRTNLRGE